MIDIFSNIMLAISSGLLASVVVSLALSYLQYRKKNMPYRESEIVTDKVPSYTWSFKLGMLDAMKLMSPRDHSALGDILWAIFFVAGLLVFGFGWVTAKAVIAHGVAVPWVRRELIVWCISLAFWLVAFIRPYISKERK